jgi:hypothetical protein
VGTGAGVAAGVGACGDCSCSDRQKEVAGRSIEPYPMDYYAKDGGPWNSSYHKVQSSGAAVRRPGGGEGLKLSAAAGEPGLL